MAFKLFKTIDSNISKDPYESGLNRSSHQPPSPYSLGKYPSSTGLERYFIHPMDLCEPDEDILGYTQVCSLRLDEISDLKRSKLNTPTTVQNRLLISFTIRLWSRASGRYVQILPVGAIPYARGIFGARGAFQMLIWDEMENIVLLRSSSHPQFYLGVKRNAVVGTGNCDMDSMFKLRQNKDGYVTLESVSKPGHFLGVRNNGNIMPIDQVDLTSMNAQFIIQKEAMDLI